VVELAMLELEASWTSITGVVPVFATVCAFPTIGPPTTVPLLTVTSVDATVTTKVTPFVAPAGTSAVMTKLTGVLFGNASVNPVKLVFGELDVAIGVCELPPGPKVTTSSVYCV
jgi:hypothetical protein